MSFERFLRGLGVLALGAGTGLVAYLLFDAIGSGSFAKFAAALIAIVAVLSFGWALS